MTSMKRLLLAVGMTVAIAACSGASAQHGVSSAEAHTLVEQGATLLDVRTQGEWDSGHLPGAVLIPLQSLDTRMSEVSRDHPVVVYCQSGARAAQATSMLVAAGYDARNLGGIGDW